MFLTKNDSLGDPLLVREGTPCTKKEKEKQVGLTSETGSAEYCPLFFIDPL